MSEAGDRLGFLCESFDERRVVGVVGRQNLDRDVTVQIGVERPEYGGHPSAPVLFNHAISAKAAA